MEALYFFFLYIMIGLGLHVFVTWLWPDTSDPRYRSPMDEAGGFLAMMLFWPVFLPLCLLAQAWDYVREKLRPSSCEE